MKPADGQLDLFGERPTLRRLWEQDAADAEIRAISKASHDGLALNASVAPADVPRLSASLQRLYDHMRAGGWHTGPELIPVAGLRYGARLEELSRAGHPFQKEHVAEGVWRYRLIGPPTPPKV